MDLRFREHCTNEIRRQKFGYICDFKRKLLPLRKHSISNAMKKLFILWLCLSGMCYVNASGPDFLLKELDKVIAEREIYEQQKQERIATLKEQMAKSSLSDEELYRLNESIYAEYENYISDSALHYINKNIELVSRMGNPRYLTRSMLKKIRSLSTSGLFVEAFEQLKSLPKAELQGEDLTDYYIIMKDIYLFLSEYTSSEYRLRYNDKIYAYSDSIMGVAPEGSYPHMLAYSQLLMQQRKWDDAVSMLERYLEAEHGDLHQYAVMTSTLAFLYRLLGNKEKEKEMRIQSVIADLKGVVAESYSLCALAELLFEEGDLVRSERCVKVSLDVSNKYQARLRSLQTSQILPVIDKTYQQMMTEQRNRLAMLVVGIGILSICLSAAIFYIRRQMKKLEKARREIMVANIALNNLNDELKTLNASLLEANGVKEEYLGRFLQQCSDYIDKLENYRRMLNKLAVAKKLDELYNALKSNKVMEEELKEFYRKFDTSFLKIFPSFIEEFNALLPEEERIVPKSNELLTTDLRIFALIRLGITDSNQIACFLRYSLTTIYTYRSKIKKRSLYKEDFEERVLSIKSF